MVICLGVICTTMVMLNNSSYAAQSQKLVPRVVSVIWNQIKVRYNDKAINTDRLVNQGESYLPLRAIRDALGKQMFWDSLTNTLTIKDIPPKTVTKTQEILFGEHYTNLAWGRHIRGWFMDSAGNVYYYDLKPDETLIRTDREGYISKQDVQHNLSYAKKVYSVGFEELSQNYKLAQPLINNSVLNQPRSTAYDMGNDIFVYYAWDATREKYKQILLQASGDVSQENTNPCAKELYEWLYPINQRVWSILKSKM